MDRARVTELGSHISAEMERICLLLQPSPSGTLSGSVQASNQGCIRGEEGGGEGFWRGRRRGSGKNPPPPVVSGLNSQRKFSLIIAQEILRLEAEENFSPENCAENLWAGSRIGRGGGRGGGLGGLGGGSSYGCQAFQYIPASNHLPPIFSSPLKLSPSTLLSPSNLPSIHFPKSNGLQTI